MKRLKVLFLSQRFLFPMDTGGKIRTGKILEQLKYKISLTVISNVESPKDDKFLPEMDRLCDRFIPIPWKETKRFSIKFYTKIAIQSLSKYPISVLNDYSMSLRKALLQELKDGDYDLAICDFLQSTLNFKRVIDIPTILFQHNVESTITQRHLEKAANPVSKLFWFLQHRKMFKYENRMCKQFNGIIAVSKVDKERMESWFNAKNVYNIPTGVDTEYYKPSENGDEKNQIVFTGSMDWLPNMDAMMYFIEKIFPIIKEKEPGTKLIIVGRNPSNDFLKQIDGRKDIVATGWVDDTRPYMAESKVFIVPIRIGGGTRMKIYEAMAMGKPVVSTIIGAEGLDLTHGNQIFFADDEKSFANYVIDLLRKEELRKELGMHARKFVYENYRWEKVANVFEKICEKVINEFK